LLGENGHSNAKVPDSVVRIELISFYHRNPEFFETSEEIVKNFEYRAEQVCGQLEKLVHLKILEKVEEDGTAFYRYLPPFSCGDLKSIRYLTGVNGFKGPTNGKDEELTAQEAK
jgi:hypothetical protein